MFFPNLIYFQLPFKSDNIPIALHCQMLDMLNWPGQKSDRQPERLALVFAHPDIGHKDYLTASPHTYNPINKTND